MKIEISDSEYQVIQTALAVRAAVLRTEIDQSNDRELRTSLRTELDCLADLALRFPDIEEPVAAVG